MSRITRLPLSVLARILYEAALPPVGKLHEWKKKLSLLAVCQAWTRLAETFVLNHVFVEVSEACTCYDISSDISTHSTHVAWTSNAELIISRNCMLNTKRLTIELPEGATLDHLRHIVLGVLHLDRVDWPHVNTLSITYPSWSCGHDIKPASMDEQAVADVKRTMQYFGQNMRGIVELNLTGPIYENVEELAYVNLASIYGGRLQIFRSTAPVALDISHFSRKIAVLELSLDPTATRAIPTVCSEALKVLRLYNIPHNFAWHYFRYDFYSMPIVFRRLTVLHLRYDLRYDPATEGGVQSKVALGALNCDQLVFPVLKRLTIESCTPDCDLLYAEAPFAELKSVQLTGLLSEIDHCSRLKLVWVGDLRVKLNLSVSDEAVRVCSVTNHFFSDICIGRTATLKLSFGPFTLDPELIRWVNLTNLVVGSISYRALCRVIARLPNLLEFQTHTLEFGATTAESLAMDESLFSSMDPLLAWGEKLTTVLISAFDQGCPLAVRACGMQAFILNAGALIELTVPVIVEPRIGAFIYAHKDTYPHLAKISVNR